MTTPVYYLAHKFQGDRSNLAKALRWCSVLSWEFDALFVAPWVPPCIYWANDGEWIKRGMYLNFTAIREAQGIILVGGCISEHMVPERDFAASCCGKAIIDASRYSTPEELLADPAGVELVTGFIDRRNACG